MNKKFMRTTTFIGIGCIVSGIVIAGLFVVSGAPLTGRSEFGTTANEYAVIALALGLFGFVLILYSLLNGKQIVSLVAKIGVYLLFGYGVFLIMKDLALMIITGGLIPFVTTFFSNPENDVTLFPDYNLIFFITAIMVSAYMIQEYPKLRNNLVHVSSKNKEIPPSISAASQEECIEIERARDHRVPTWKQYIA